MSDSDAHRIFKPEIGGWNSFLVGLLILAVIVAAKHRGDLFQSWIAAPFLLAYVAFNAYLSFFGWKGWVFLYEDRLEFGFPHREGAGNRLSLPDRGRLP